MGWVWRDDEDGEGKLDFAGNGRKGDVCTTRKSVRTSCKTEEVEPGKFLRKCHKTEEILRDCLGKPTEIVQSNSEYTEEDVTDKLSTGSYSQGQITENSPFSFPGLRSDIGEIERHLFDNFRSFFDATEEMKSSLFNIFDGIQSGPSSSSSSSRRIPIDGVPDIGASTKRAEKNYPDFDLSGAAKDV